MPRSTQAVALMLLLAQPRLPQPHQVQREHLAVVWWLKRAQRRRQQVRLPLWPVTPRDSRKLGSHQVVGVPVLDLHELAAGKLAALLSRHASRDLYDAHQLLTRATLDPTRLRLAFVVYGAMNRKDWRTVTADDVGFNPAEVERELLPTLRREAENARDREAAIKAWIAETRATLRLVLPMTASELGFIEALAEHGEIKPELLTSDAGLADIIRRQPMLEWKAQHARGKR